MTRRIELTDTILRDAHQSLMATRMSYEDMAPVLKDLDSAGYYSLECWGGATFDACIRYLNEDPWERLKKLKAHLPNTKLQMLLRGQNVLGYRHYADDVVEKFVALSAKNGIDVFRIFDALNDPRNLETSMRAVKASGKEAQLAICYTTSDVHTVSYFVDLAKRYEQMGADSICIKDMAGILTPHVAKTLISTMKAAISVPLILHTHCTSGTAEMTYQAAIEAGIDRIETAISPFSGGTSQPSSETFVIILKELGYDITVDLNTINRVADHFKKVKAHYIENGTMLPKVLTSDPRALIYQVPGGMLSNMYAQLGKAGKLDLIDQVLAEVPQVRKDMGYPPLVTPLSQMVGTQATMNIISGERYKMVPKEIKAYLQGEYGQSPAPVDPTFRQSIIGDAPVMTDRPANHIPHEWNIIREEIGDLAKTEEDVLIYAMFPQLGKEFLTKKYKTHVVEKNAESTPIRVYGIL